MLSDKKVFVTVGTTQFNKLIEQVHSDSVLARLESLGYKTITLQVGQAKGIIEERNFPGLKLNYVKFIDNFLGAIKESDLVISHAGAGSCLDVLRCGKPLIVVINEELMDNHQSELAEQLDCDNYVYCCTPSGIRDILDKDLKELKKYPKASKHLFSNYLNKAMGFI